MTISSSSTGIHWKRLHIDQFNKLWLYVSGFDVQSPGHNIVTCGFFLNNTFPKIFLLKWHIMLNQYSSSVSTEPT